MASNSLPGNTSQFIQLGTNMLAGEKEFAATIPGTAIAVLYDSAKPKHSTAYEYGGYVCL